VEKVLKITRDASANVKTLKDLESKGFIKVNDVMLEGGRENRKFSRKILPGFCIGHTRIGEGVVAGDNNPYEEIRNIIGRKNVGDALHLEAHIRSCNDYFVTEDKDFLGNREELNKRFDVKILTPEELRNVFKQT